MNYIILSPFNNIFENLSLEEYFLEHTVDNYFLIYRNNKTIVIGRNQNPWLECNMKSIKNQHLNFARRISGGGSVFHDLGNINISFIESRIDYDLNSHINITIDSLKNLGINACWKNGLDITVQELKVSGNSFAHKKNRSLHHATLLIESNLKNLNTYLNPQNLNIQSKSIVSRKAKVSNLNNFNKKINIDCTIKELIRQYKIKINAQKIELSQLKLDYKILNKIITRHKSFEWKFGKTTNFVFTLKYKEDFGVLILKFIIEKAKVKKILLEGNVFEKNEKKLIIQNLLNLKMNSKLFINKLTSLTQNQKKLNTNFNKRIYLLINFIKKYYF